MKKWEIARPSHYLGIDIAESSISDAKVRLRAMKTRMNAHFDVADCFHSPLYIRADGRGVANDSLGRPESPFLFDVISCMFSFHYAFENEASVKTSLENVSRHLKPNGIFIITIPKASVIEHLKEKAMMAKSFPYVAGNSLFEVEFHQDELTASMADDSFPIIKYHFSLKEAVKRCPEFSVPMEVLFPIAVSKGLSCESEMDFLKFFEDYRDHPSYSGLLQRFGLLDRATHNLCLYPDELETVGKRIFTHHSYHA